MANDTTSELNAPLPRIPRMMTIRQVASTGILPETALRTMVKDGTIPAVFAGCKAFMSSVFSYGKSQGYVKENPCSGALCP